MIYYFSATGNCKYVAQRLGQALNEPTCSIFAPGAAVCTLAPGERLGFVCPTYAWGLPSVMEEFLSRFACTGSPAAPVFWVSTYGTTPGNSAYFANKLLHGQIHAFYSIKMPDTWTPMFDLSDPARVAALNAAAETELDAVIARIQRGETPRRMRRQLPRLTVPVYKRFYAKLRQTKNFTVDDSCIGCGLCAKKCPVQAIEMQAGRPHWTQPTCAMCLGCLHRCPQFAIQYGSATRAHGQYRNPHVQI